MITTVSFPNTITNSPEENIERNSLTKEDLEGGKIKQNIGLQNINGGNTKIIKDN